MLLSSARVVLRGLLLFTGLIAPAVGICTQSNPEHAPAIVELYTSQGCSSCPPADHLLGELAAMPDVIALAFHVDYWDSLGWRDPFEVSAASARAQGYVQALGLSSAFTPQVVVDGRTSLVGSDKRRILQALADAREKTLAVRLDVSDGNLTVTLPDAAQHNLHNVYAVAYLPHATTQVGRGENSGATLEEFNIVREFRSIGTWNGNSVVFHVPLRTFPPDASRVAVLVQRDGQGPMAGGAAIAFR